MTYSTGPFDVSGAGYDSSAETSTVLTCRVYNASVWYRFVATAAFTTNLDTLGSDYDTVLTVFQGSSFTNLVSTACNDDVSSSIRASQLSNIPLFKGVTYYFMVGAYGTSAAGNLVFSATMTPVAFDSVPPTVGIVQPVSGSTLTALASLAGTAADAGASNPGVNSISLRISSGALDWNGSAWTASIPVFLTPSFSPGTSISWNYYSVPPWQNAAVYQISVFANDYSGNTSTAVASSFTFSVPAVSPNDNYATPAPIMSIPAAFATNNISAVPALQKTPSCPSAGGNRDLWWQYVSTVSAGAQANTFGSNFDTVLAVWSSTGGVLPVPGSEVGCNDDSGGSNQSKVSFPLQSGTTYFLQVFGYNSNPGGNVALQFSVSTDTTPPAVVNDLSAAADSTPGAVRLAWTAVGDDGNSGTAASYDIRYSTTGPIANAVAFNSAASIRQAPTNVGVAPIPPNDPLTAPSSAGSSQSQFIHNLLSKTTYWFSLQAQDAAGNIGPLSNSATVQTAANVLAAVNLTPTQASTATVIPFNDKVTVVSGANATEKTPACGSFPPATSADVWYRYVSTAAGMGLTANTFNSNFDTLLQVWQDNGGVGNPSQFVSVACNDNDVQFSPQSKVVFVSSAATYYIQVVNQVNGTLNFQLGQADTTNPGQITTLAAGFGAANQNGEVNLSWIEPADNGYIAGSGAVAQYFIRYSSANSINAANWFSTSTVLDLQNSPLFQVPPRPAAPGNPQSFTIRNLNPGTTYWFAARSMDAAGNLSDVSNSPFTPARAPTAQPGDGQGSVELRDAGGSNILTSVPVSSQVTVNIRFIVSQSSMTGGAKVTVRIPDYWSQPDPANINNPGYVSLSTITPSIQLGNLSLSLDPADPRVMVVTLAQTGKLDAGSIFNIRYNNGWAQYNKQAGVQFLTKSQASSSGALLPIPTQPSLGVVAGAAVNVGFTDWNTITLGTGALSPSLFIEPKDSSWQSAMAGKNLYLRAFGLYFDSATSSYRYDNSAQFFDASGSTLTTGQVSTNTFTAAQWNGALALAQNATYYQFIIPSGSNGQSLYYKTTTVGNTIIWIEYNANGDFGVTPALPMNATQRWLNVRSVAPAFNNLAVTPNTLSPNNDSIADYASISFVPTLLDTQWRVRIGTDVIFTQPSPLPFNVGNNGNNGTAAGGPAATGVAVSSINVFFEQWGQGIPQGVAWYGNDYMGNVVRNSGPDTTYYARVEDAGGSAVSVATFTVTTPFLQVFVTTVTGCGACQGSGLPNVSVSVNGPSGQGFVNRTKSTRSDGGVTIYGLNNNAYTLNATYFDPVSNNSLAASLNNLTAGLNAGAVSTITLTQPMLIRVHANIPAPQGYDLWGGLNVADATGGNQLGFGALRFQSGNTESDSGWSPSGFPSTWTVIAVQPGANVKLHADLFGYGSYNSSAFTVNSQTDVVISFVRKPRVLGRVVLPAIQPNGTWVSIEGTQSGGSFPTAWGGTWIPGANDFSGGRATGAFAMDIDTGAYTLRARAFGLGTTAFTNVAISSSGIGSLPSGVNFNPNDPTQVIQNGFNFVFSTPSAGATGYVRVEGDSTQLPSYQVQNGSFTLYINAFNNANYSYANSQVQLPLNAAVSSGPYAIPGLDDGTYQMYTFLQGFEIFPPGPKTVTVTNGVGNLNLTLRQDAGKLKILVATTAAGGYNNITLNLSGPNTTLSTGNITGLPGFTQLPSSAQVIVTGLGTGFYNVSLFYNGRRASRSVSVINDPNLLPTVDFTTDLTANVYTVTGTVRVQSFTFGVSASSTGRRIDTVSDLLANTGTENLSIGTGTVVAPIARIEAYPRSLSNFSGQISDDYVHISGPGSAGVAANNPQYGFGDLRFGAIISSGSVGYYQIPNLSPGVYLLRHPVNLDPNAVGIYNNSAGSSFEANTADVVYEEKTVLISTLGVITVINPQGGDFDFTYRSGSQVSGQISLPPDIPSDTRFLTLRALNSRGETVSYQIVYLNGASVNYKLPALGNGDYTLTIEDERKGDETNWNQYLPCGGSNCNRKKYVAKPLKVTIKGGDLPSQDIQLYRAGTVEGKLAIVRISSDGTKSTELITSNNVSRLPANFSIFAFSDSAGRGVSGETDMICNNGCTLSIDATKGTFRLSYLLPNTDYKVEFQQSNFSADNLGQGKLNIAPQEMNGVSVDAGQSLDLGTIELSLGASISGAVTDSSNGNPIPNIRIEAVPVNNNHSADVSAYTDAKGSFTITGLDPDERYYNIFFAARGSDDGTIDFGGLTNNSYAQKVKRNVDVRVTSAPLSVALDLGPGTITGRVVTPDGGPLKNPFGDGGSGKGGYPVAQIIANKQGDIPTNNPIGDIQVQTDLNGGFKIDRLSTGAYDLYAFSQGYGVVRKLGVAVSNSSVDAGTILLTTGVALSGNIVKTDGSHPTTSDVNTLVAVTADFSDITVGSLNNNSQTGTVDSYVMAGLKPGTTYTILMFNEENDTVIPPERYPAGGTGVCLSTDVSNFNLTFAQAKPEVFLKAVKTAAANQYRFVFDTSQPLRNKTIDEKSDTYWTKVVSVTGGAGSLLADPQETSVISPDRKKVILLCNATGNKVTVRFTAPTAVLQPGATQAYAIDTSFDFFLGLDGQKIGKINMSQGGSITIEGDPSTAEIPAGAFKDGSGNVLPSSTSVSMGLQRALDVQTASTSVSGAPALNGGPASSPLDNLPPVLGRAIQSMHSYKQNSALQAAPGLKGATALNASDVTGANVLGAFYDFFLPAGVSRTLNKNAKVTLSYSSSTTDTSSMNVYFFNDQSSTVTTTNGVSVPPNSYGIENTSRTLDAANNTISVSVNHFTVYVVVNSTQPVLFGADILGSNQFTLPNTIAFTGTEIEAFNFPNPFNASLRGFTFTATKTSGQQTVGVTGATAIRYALPANLGSGPVNVSLEIFDVAGDLVRRIDLGSQTTGLYHYGDWDGKNEDGRTVASGVYIGRLAVAGTNRDKIFKMAVIK